MGLYSDSVVIKGLEELNAFFSGKHPDYDKNIIINKDDSDSVLFNKVLASSWRSFFYLVKNNVVKLDSNTRFNQEYISERMRFTVQSYKENEVIFLSDLMRVLYEFNFWTGEPLNSDVFSHGILTRIHDSYGVQNSPYAQFDWIRDTLSSALVQWLVNGEKFTQAKIFLMEIDARREKFLNELNTTGSEYQQQIDGALSAAQEMLEKRSREQSNVLSDQHAAAITELTEHFSKIQSEIENVKSEATTGLEYIKSAKVEINALEQRIENLKSEYNFVGLSSGFNQIKDKKEKELRDVEMNYKNLFGCIFIAPVLAVILHFVYPSLYPKDYSAIFIALPFFTIEMALIYFFRLSYLEAKSIRTQLVQIELRLSLCAFIDGYVEYRRKNETDVSKVLDCFDSLIFSPIQMNENNIPSMFDGVEAIAGLAEKVMKK
ncbi:hypothetical protein [Kosakonia cowanii]|uniref:hypothetical protein n=1 Tax=Kosakonia cowanii TaxID=208223 RepID=UPI0040629831